MNAIGSIEAASSCEPFNAARDEVTAWRGRCLDLFARSEAAVTETLLALATLEERGSLIKLPHLVGQRYDSLAGALGPGGPFEEEGQAATAALATFRQHDQLRTVTTHGVFTVTLDCHGRWYLIARVLAFRSGRESREIFVAEQSEAAQILSALEKDSSRVRSSLRQLRRGKRLP